MPISTTFFATVADYLNTERPADATTDRVFVALKGPTRGGPLSASGLDEVMAGARGRAGLARGTCHELRHTCFTRLREAGMAIEALQALAGHRSIASTRIYLHLGADWLADEYWRAAAAIDVTADSGADPMSARPLPAVAFTAEPAVVDRRPAKEISWPQIIVAAPQMAATMARYLDQLAVSARPGTVVAVDLDVAPVRRLGHRHRPGLSGHGPGHPTPTSRTTNAGSPPGPARTAPCRRPRSRVGSGCCARFFERIIEWGYDDAPARVPIFAGDFPDRDEPLPKFLDDPTAAKFMAALAADPNPRRRLMVEILARTGIRSGELSGLDDDAMVLIGDTHWLRIPVGKLHNDRYVPLLPILVELITDHRATRGPPRSGRLVERNDGQPFDRRTIHRYVTAVAKRAGVGPVHPHQLRHTLATQAINRGMSLEAIAALLGHRSMKMTLTYARISDRTVADEYFRVTAAVEANYHQRPDRHRRRRHDRPRRRPPPAPRQRPLHPTRRARLHPRIDLRTLRLLRHRTRVRARPHPPTRPRHRPRPTDRRASSSPACSTTSTPPHDRACMTPARGPPITRITAGP